MEICLEPLPVVPVDIMARLRHGTQDLHTRIENRLDFSVHFASLAAYRQLLERYYGFYRPFETVLSAAERAGDWADLGIGFAARRKTPWLEDDLKTLGLGAEPLRAVPLCAYDALPHPRAASELLGCAYVLEGATLGGKVIGRHIEQTLHLAVGAPGARFFFGYGAESGQRWKRFRQAAEAFAERETARRPVDGDEGARQAVDFARQTFTALERHLFSM